MNILIASFTFPPNRDGVSEAASTMALGFVENGWDVDVATSPVTPPRSEMEWCGVRIHEFAITGNGSLNNPCRGDSVGYQDFLRQGKWDVVIFHAYSWSLYVPLGILHRIPGKKVLVSHSFNALRWERAKAFPWGLLGWFCSVYWALQMFGWLKAIDRPVYLSSRKDFRGFFDHWIASVLGHQGRRVIPNGVEPELRGRNVGGFRDGLGITDNQVMFLYVANYSKGKDQGFAVRAFRAANISNAVMVFIGSVFNSDSARYQAQDDAIPQRLKAGRVIWLEKLGRQKTLDAFAACDVFVFSSAHEAQPIVLLEAMREAKPWVARDVGCVSEMPGGVCIRSESEMTRQLIRLSLDLELRASLGKQGRAAIDMTYNRKNYVKSYCDLVSEVTMSDG